jgi:ATPase subunit of ABC transporter with duplicated ATPase domains
VTGLDGALVVVSHDRAFLDRVVTGIVEVEPGSHRVREWAGGWSEYEAARDLARSQAYESFERSQEQRRDVEALLNERRNQARAGGAMADRRGTHALMTKVRQSERAVERVGRPEKPFEPWQLQLSIEVQERLGDRVLALEGAIARRGAFRLGPVDFELAPGDRVAVTGRNGAGKSTLLAMLLGDLELEQGRRVVGRRTVVGSLEQGRGAYGGPQSLLDAFRERTGLEPEEARTLLAKFNLGAEHVHRPGGSLSPGERTRAHLAELSARGVNCLVLDEPTNHLDLEAVEQLEHALRGFEGACVVVSHDRRFLERLAPTSAMSL